MKTPLADRIRPKTLDEVVGQKHLIGEGKILRNIIENDEVPNMIFYGPSGVGKTTIANIIAQKTGKTLHRLNATTASVADIKNIVSTLDSFLAMDGVLLYLDEIQHFNKKQQQSLLEFMENGKITLIASTTENPYFYVYNAVLSRSVVFEFKQIEPSEIEKALERAVEELKQSDYKGFDVTVDKDAIRHMAHVSNGDVRKALTYLEAAFFVTQIDETKEKLTITEEVVKDVTSKQILNFDEDEHYNTISAFIKSVRGSDTNAAIYYLARMLESGEDPRYIARRLCILASEDIGLAEPEAINIASSLINIIEFIGMPEGRIPLAEVTIYLSLCPKSNSAYKAIDSAIRDIRNGELYSIPNYLKDNNSASFDKKSEEEYKYPHDFPYHIVKQDYLEKGIKKNYYNPVDIGEERELKKVYEWIMNHIN